MDYKTEFKKYLVTWRPAKATKMTHGWEGWYVKRYNEDYFGNKPYTEQQAIAKAKELNNA
jgi:hypothetical protein